MRDSFWSIVALVVIVAGTVRAQDVPRPMPQGIPPCLLPDPIDPSLSPQRPTMLPDCSPPPRSPAQLALIGEYRLMTSRWRDSDFALSDPSTNLIAPQGPVVSVPGSAHSGFRVGVAYRAGGSPWEFGVFYTNLRASDSATTAAVPGGMLRPLLTRPGTVDMAAFAQATERLIYDVYDLEVGRNVLMDNSLGLRVVGGVRFASIGQDFDAFYNGIVPQQNGSVANQAVVSNRFFFRGAGPVVGGEAHWTFGWGFSLFGRTRGGLVMGEADVRHRETNNAGATVWADTTDSFSETVPVVEMGAGVAWQFRRFWVRAGYDATNWFQLVDHPIVLDAIAPRPLRRETSLSLDGFFLQVGGAF